MKALQQDTKPEHRRLMVVSGLLILITVAVYWPVVMFEFTNCDDPIYVTGNEMVQKGLSPQTIAWAFTTMEAQFWHPLTWLSHMVDCQSYGLKAGGHHLTNLLLHLASTLLLFGGFRRMTGALWQSGLVAALFALHPLHVESVAWVAERKDVLSTFFWMLTLWVYARYAETCEPPGAKINASAQSSRRPAPALRPSLLAPRHQSQITGRRSLLYGLTLLFFVLGLMSKPMLVTLPFVLLLLDFWPLRRFDLSSLISYPPAFSRLLKEKVPFLLLAVAASAAAFVAQHSGHSLTDLAALSPGARISNALVSYVRYLQKLVWPVDLSVYYPHPGAWPLALVAGASLFLVIVTIIVMRRIRAQPWLAMGWLWYIGTLVPVIGLVQVGRHAMADRYTYIPLIGIFVMLVWGMSESPGRSPARQSLLRLAAGLVIAGCVIISMVQLNYWKNGETLFAHALAATGGDYRMHNSLGAALFEQGRLPEAVDQYEQALRLTPGDPEVHSNLGSALFRQGRVPEGIGHLEESLRLDPNDAAVHYNLGNALFQLGRVPEAITHYQQVVRLKPDFVKAHYNLGVACFRLGQVPEAVTHYEQSLRLKPDYVNARINLGTALLQLGRVPEAAEQCRQALRFKPDSADAQHNLARALLQLGQVPEAVQRAERACQLATNGVADYLDTLGMAYSDAGRFNEAARAAQAALSLAQAGGQAELAGAILERLRLYQARRPYPGRAVPPP